MFKRILIFIDFDKEIILWYCNFIGIPFHTEQAKTNLLTFLGAIKPNHTERHCFRSFMHQITPSKYMAVQN